MIFVEQTLNYHIFFTKFLQISTFLFIFASFSSVKHNLCVDEHFSDYSVGQRELQGRIDFSYITDDY